MKVTVTGAAGRLGTTAVRALHARGHDIHATDRVYQRDALVKIDLANLLDRDACYRLVEGADVLVHLGNHPGMRRRDAQGCYGENCQMNINIIQAAIDVGVKKIIYASSVQVICGNRRNDNEPVGPSELPYLPADGHTPANALNAYSLSKKACEDLLYATARLESIQTIAVRFPLLLSERHHAHLQQRPMTDYEKLDEAFAYLHFDDAAELVADIVAADLPGARIYFPCGPGTVLQTPIPEIVARYYPDVPLKQPVETLDSLVDISQITRETGWKPRRAAYEPVAAQ